MNAELILACVLGFFGGMIFTILLAVSIVKKLVRCSAVMHVGKEED